MNTLYFYHIYGKKSMNEIRGKRLKNRDTSEV